LSIFKKPSINFYLGAGDAHLKSILFHHEVIIPITKGALDFGPWQQVFYGEFDGRRKKRLVVKVMGE